MVWQWGTGGRGDVTGTIDLQHFWQSRTHYFQVTFKSKVTSLLTHGKKMKSKQEERSKGRAEAKEETECGLAQLLQCYDFISG